MFLVANFSTSALDHFIFSATPNARIQLEPPHASTPAPSSTTQTMARKTKAKGSKSAPITVVSDKQVTPASPLSQTDVKETPTDAPPPAVAKTGLEPGAMALKIASSISSISQKLSEQERYYEERLRERDDRIIALEKHVDGIAELMSSLLDSVNKANERRLQEDKTNGTAPTVDAAVGSSGGEEGFSKHEIAAQAAALRKEMSKFNTLCSYTSSFDDPTSEQLKYEQLAQRLKLLCTLADEATPRMETAPETTDDIPGFLARIHRFKYDHFVSDEQIYGQVLQAFSKLLSQKLREFEEEESFLVEFCAGQYFHEANRVILWSKLFFRLNTLGERLKGTEERTIQVARGYTQEASAEGPKDEFTRLWDIMNEDIGDVPLFSPEVYEDRSSQEAVAYTVWRSYQELVQYAKEFFETHDYSLDEMKEKFSKLWEACPIIGWIFSRQFGLRFLDEEHLDSLTETTQDLGIPVFEKGPDYCDLALGILERERQKLVEILVAVMFDPKFRLPGAK